SVGFSYRIRLGTRHKWRHFPRRNFCSDLSVRTSEAVAVSRSSIQGTLASPNQVAGPRFRRATPDAWEKDGRSPAPTQVRAVSYFGKAEKALAGAPTAE